MSKDKIHKLQLALDEKKVKNEYNVYKLKELKQKNEKLSKSLPKYEEKVERFESYVAGKQEDTQKSKELLQKYQEQLKSITKVRIQQLIRYIFPISRVEAKP